MFRASKDTWVRLARTTACMVTLAALTNLALATVTLAPAAAPWRAFAPSSPWNLPVDPSSIAPSNPYADQFAGSPNHQMALSGTPDNPVYSSPVYFAQPGDPFVSVDVGQPGWAPQGATKYTGQPIPVPAGVTPASGSDGHLVVVSADRNTAWDFYRATAAGPGGYKADVVVQWDLTGPGYATKLGDNSARASGTPLISTTLRADEALNGINHALGITVPSVSSDYVYPPASHSDGNDGPDAIKYGMLFVLRPDYPMPANASIGVRNVIQALKTYGAYVIDKGADFEMDADFTHPDIWAQTGLSETTFDFTGADFRPAKAGAVPPTPPAEKANVPKSKRKRVTISVDRHRLRLGGQLKVTGKVRGRVVAGAHVRVLFRTRHGEWRRLRRKPVNADGTFATWPRLLRTVTASRAGKINRYTLRGLHIGRHTRLIRMRAVVTRAGRSNVVRVRIRLRPAPTARHRKAAVHRNRTHQGRHATHNRQRHRKRAHGKRSHRKQRAEQFVYA
jgi:hypothetical protein